MEPQEPARPEWKGLLAYAKYVAKNLAVPDRTEYDEANEQYRQRLGEYNIALNNERAEQREVELQLYKERRAHEKWVEFYAHHLTAKFDEMTGEEFEFYLQSLFSKLNFDVQLTKSSGDQGADLVLKHRETRVRIAVQAKCCMGTVGNRAVQEVLGAMEYYKCSRGIVVTNSMFSKSAWALAHKSRKQIDLWNRTKLEELHRKYFPDDVPAIPEFNLKSYLALKKRGAFNQKSYRPRVS